MAARSHSTRRTLALKLGLKNRVKTVKKRGKGPSGPLDTQTHTQTHIAQTHTHTMMEHNFLISPESERDFRERLKLFLEELKLSAQTVLYVW